MQRAFEPWDGSPDARRTPDPRAGEREDGRARPAPRPSGSSRVSWASRRWRPRAAGTATASPAAVRAATSTCRRPASARRGAWGIGSIHHLAWRVADEAHQAACASRIDAAGRRPDAGHRSLLVQVGLLPGAGWRALRAGDRRPRLRRRRGSGAPRRGAGAAAMAGAAARRDRAPPCRRSASRRPSRTRRSPSSNRPLNSRRRKTCRRSYCPFIRNTRTFRGVM